MNKKCSFQFGRDEIDLLLFCLSLSGDILEKWMPRKNWGRYDDIAKKITAQSNKLYEFYRGHEDEYTENPDRDEVLELFCEETKEYLQENEGIRIIEDEEEIEKLYFSSTFLEKVVKDLPVKSKFYKYIPTFDLLKGRYEYPEHTNIQKELLGLLRDYLKNN